MSISLSNLVLPFKGNWFDPSQPPKTFSAPFHTSESLQTSLETKNTKLIQATITPRVSRTDESLPSVIPELQRDKTKKKSKKNKKKFLHHPRDKYQIIGVKSMVKMIGSNRPTAKIRVDTLRWPQVWSRNANWIGYVSVSNDEMTKHLGRRDISIAWRGTVTRLEWIADLMDYLRPIASDKIPCPDPTVKVESGFLNLYTDKDQNCRFCTYSARDQILSEIRRLMHLYPNEELSITITGHSLGSALAILSAYDIVETGLNIQDDGQVVPISVFSFSGPRVGNVRFKDRLEGLGVKVLRVVNVHDKVPTVSGIFFNEHVPSFVQKMAEGIPWCYSHVGVELALDHKKSPFLKDTGNLSCFHNLEAHLHLLDGYHGKDERFVLSSGRDPALVNKASDFLKDRYLVPPFWRQDENKGMVRKLEGRWMQPERLKHDDHPHDIHYYLTQLGLVSDY